MLRQTDPGGVVGVGVDDGTDAAALQVAFELRAELLAAIVVDVERLVAHALHLQLHLLHGEAWVDEQHGVLRLVGLRAGEERCKRALHAAADRHAALGSHVDADERLDKARGLTLQLGVALYVGIAVGNAVLQGLHLRFDTHAGSGQARDAHLHLDKLYAALFLCHGSHLLDLAYGGLGKVLYA